MDGVTSPCYPASARKATSLSRLLPVQTVKLFVLLLSTGKLVLCANKSGSLGVLPISLPATEYWYAAPNSTLLSILPLSIDLGTVMTARGLPFGCKLALQRKI